MVITEGRIIVAASMRWARGQDDGILDRFWLDQAAGAGGRIHLGSVLTVSAQIIPPFSAAAPDDEAETEATETAAAPTSTTPTS